MDWRCAGAYLNAPDVPRPVISRPWNLPSGRKGGADDHFSDHRSGRDNRHGNYQYPHKAALTLKTGVGKPTPATPPKV
jgi:hypothetical protein